MGKFKQLILILLILIFKDSFAQWPGAFYAFELKDHDGKFIDSSSKDYKLSVDTIAPGPTSIEICTDNRLWKFYKGDKNLYVVNFLIIEKLIDGKVTETMQIKFPPPLTNGKEKYYANMYVGQIIFSPGSHKIRLPKTTDDWDALKEKEYCPNPNNYNKYLDISRFQKR